MTDTERGAAWTLLGMIAAAAAGAFLLGAFRRRGPRRRPRRNPWVTLKRRSKTGHRQRVFIDDDGRIEIGLPEKYRGVHIGDLTELGRQERRTRKRAAREARRIFRGRLGGTFRSKDVAFKELLAANPPLHDFLQREFGRAEVAYRAWRRGGRRGPKPQLALKDDGRLDAINYAWDLHGPRAAGSWIEAVYASIPSSKRWDDFAERLPVLEEATGIAPIVMPAPAEKRALRRQERAAVDDATEQSIDELVARARSGRLAAGRARALELEEAPF